MSEAPGKTAVMQRQRQRKQQKSERADLLALIFATFAADPTVSGVTYLAADGSDPVYVDRATATAPQPKKAN
jgi:hypothetical protein